MQHDHEKAPRASSAAQADHAEGGHHHGPTRSSELGPVSDARLLWAIGLNQLLTVGQIIAGLVSGSVALLSDAAHNFNDANALLIAYIARRISRKRANQKYTFGYRRAELIGALINLTLLAAVAMYLTVEAVNRFLFPTAITGWLMAAAAGLALVVDVATAWLLWTMSRGSINVRAAFVHNIVDALGSLAVLAGAAAIIWLDWVWVDPALTLLIAGYVLWQVAAMLPSVVRTLMQAAPDDLDLERLISDLESLEGVESVHHVHAWELDEQHRSLEAHVVIGSGGADQLETIKQRVKERLADVHSISHSTLEFEFGGASVDVFHDCGMTPDD